MKQNYQLTMTACFAGYVVQAIVNNFAPLLFLTFQRSFGIPLEQITMLVTINFGIQLLVDLLSAAFVDRIGYKKTVILAQIFAAAGLVLLALLPGIMSPFPGILTSVMIYAVGGGLCEVVLSPIVEACPTDNKEKAMSLLHSFYCWGTCGRGTAVHRLFRGLRYRKLEDSGGGLGRDPGGQCPAVCKSAGALPDSGGGDGHVLSGAVYQSDFLGSDASHGGRRSQ